MYIQKKNLNKNNTKSKKKKHVKITYYFINNIIIY